MHQKTLGRAATLALSIPAALLLVSLLGLALRLYGLGASAYLDDEVISSFAARPPLPEIFREINANDTHPPGYHMLLHLWGGPFGYSLLGLRLFSALVSAACVPLTFLLGRALAGPRVGLIAALLMALAPFQILHGQQARMYPLLTAAVLLALLALIWAWRGGGWPAWVAFGLCATLGLYTHIYFAFSLLGMNLWALGEALRTRTLDRRRWAGLIASQLVASALFLVFLPQLIGITSGVVGSFWIRRATPFDWVFALLSLSNYSFLLTQRGLPAALAVPAFVLAVAAVGAGLAWAAWALLRRPAERAGWALLLWSFWTPILVATALSLTVQPIMVDRSLIGLSGPLFIMMAGAGLALGQRRPAQLLAGAYLLSCLAIAGYIYATPYRVNELERLAADIAAEAGPDDAVVYVDWQTFDTAALLHPLPAQTYTLSSTSAGVAAWQRRMAFMRWPAPGQASDSIAAIAAGRRRVLLVLTRYTPDLEHHRERTMGWLEANGAEVERREYRRAWLLIYELD